MSEQRAARAAARRLAILRHAEEVTGNVARTCRYYGISRQLFYVWKRRYEAEGLDGLRAGLRPVLGAAEAGRSQGHVDFCPLGHGWLMMAFLHRLPTRLTTRVRRY